jgi:branched-chain amino acid transport system permease protein
MSQVIITGLIGGMIYALVALSLNLQYGFTGLVNFGQVMFFAIGAYGVATAQAHGLPDWVGIVGGIGGGVLGGCVLAAFSHLQEGFWALVSLGVASFFLTIVNNTPWIAGGPLGTYGISLWSTSSLLYLLPLTIAVVLVFLERLQRSQFGRVIRAVRDDQVLVQSIGRSLIRFRSVVLVLAGAIGAMGGVFYAHWIGFVSPDAFGLSITLLIFVMVILGGPGNNWGVLIGVAIVQTFSISLQFLPSASLSAGNLALLQESIYALSLIVLLMFRRQGLWPERRRRYATAAG